MVYTQYQTMNADGQVQGLGKRCQVPYSPERLLIGFMIFHFRLLRRSVYDQIGGVDTSFERAEDYDLCLRLSEVTEIYPLKRPLYFYRQHDSNMSSNDLEMLRWTSLASQKALERRGLAERYEIRISSELTLQIQMKPDKWPLVSIIIPCYNAAETLERCLKSCFEQKYPTLEIIAVDNNSTDDTAALLEQFSRSATRPFRIVSCPQPGQNYARNAGFAEAGGEYIQWLDADDQLSLDKLMRQIVALEEQDNYDLAYGDWQWQFHKRQQLVHQLSFQGAFKNDWLLELLMDNWRPPHAYLLRRRVAEQLDELKAWNPQTPVGMDREYFTLAALAGFQPLYVAGGSVQYTTGFSSHQITQSTPYEVRVQSLKAMFKRFRQQAEKSEGVSEVYWYLLKQCWEVLEPAFNICKQDEQSCWLKHQETGEEWQVGGSKARILQTLLKLPGAYTLEDQARRIVLQLWREVVLWLRQTQGIEAALDEQIAALELAKVLGLVPAEGEVCLQMPLEQMSVEPEVAARVKMPLYVPRFGKERLRVLMVLEQLQNSGMLRQMSNQL
ncbi:glycosyltransferase [Oscillatoria sp. CS-180]|uniref:glycosyltransferase family 2 protein n=1 Tax=Oscillatoria sp. CS-180 TaxID=3021720 RepID=UPI00232F515B|nr:glycosyltransferase [Oscillatoria sp. CS-180]MDB9529632.1 glycosyltransferase [Oscillatoria sp. CS-180]